MESHDCNFHDALKRCINDRCPLHRGMRTLSSNLKFVGALFGAERIGAWRATVKLAAKKGQQP